MTAPTAAPRTARRVLVTLAVVAAGLLVLLTVRTDAVAHGGPHPTPISSGSTDDRIVLKTHPGERSTVSTFRLDFDQRGASTPWHSHPGAGLVTVVEGTFALTVSGPAGCTTRTFGPGDVFVDGGDGRVHQLVLTSDAGAVTATFVTPAGSAVSAVAPAPSC